MTPYYEDHKVTIYHANALDVLSFIKPMELVLTDPPFGVEGGSGGVKTNYLDSDFPDTPDYIKSVCVPIIESCIKIAQTVVLTPGSRCNHLYPQPDDIGGFYLPAATGHGKFGFKNIQLIYFYGKCKNINGGSLPTGSVLTESSEKNGHPCPKPINAWTWLLNRCIDKGTVFDCFMGSGTTLRAAKSLGLKAIGCDISERYCEIAAKRMSEDTFASIDYFDNLSVDNFIRPTPPKREPQTLFDFLLKE